jgi:hypothetical protein
MPASGDGREHDVYPDELKTPIPDRWTHDARDTQQSADLQAASHGALQALTRKHRGGERERRAQEEVPRQEFYRMDRRRPDVPRDPG